MLYTNSVTPPCANNKHISQDKSTDIYEVGAITGLVRIVTTYRVPKAPHTSEYKGQATIASRGGRRSYTRRRRRTSLKRLRTYICSGSR
jgi:hypothetical protein